MTDQSSRLSARVAGAAAIGKSDAETAGASHAGFDQVAGMTTVETPGRMTGAMRTGPILAATMTGIVLVTLDVSVVNVAIDALGRSFGTGVVGLGWILNSYTLAYAALLINAGWLSDRSGPGTVCMGGFAVFTAASLGCAAAPGLGWLLAARVVQGVGAAMLTAASLALLRAAYEDPRARARAIGWWAAAGSFALAGGPVLGGALIALAGWRSIFLINLPIGVLGIWLVHRAVPRLETRSTVARPNPVGQLLAIAALAALTFAVAKGGDLGWTSSPVVGGVLLAVGCSVAFIAIEHRSLAPLVPTDLFRHRSFPIALGAGCAINLSFYGLIFVLSLFLQREQGRSALETGLAFVPMTAVMLAVNPLAGRLQAGLGSRVTIAGGLALAAIGYLALLPSDASSPFVTMIPAFVLIGAGIAAATPATLAVALTILPAGRGGIGSGVINTARQVAGALGVALFGSFVSVQEDFVSGLHHALLVAGAVLVIAMAAVISSRSLDID